MGTHTHTHTQLKKIRMVAPTQKDSYFTGTKKPVIYNNLIQYFDPVKNCQLKILLLIILLGDNNIVPKKINNNIKK